MLSAVFGLAVITLNAKNGLIYAARGCLLPAKVTNRAALTDEKVSGQVSRDLGANCVAGVIKNTTLVQIVTVPRPGQMRGANPQEFDRVSPNCRTPAQMGWFRHL